MQLNRLASKFTSYQLKSLTSVMAITFTIFVTTAKAQAQIDGAPDPISSQLTGTTGQRIEGVEEIIENRSVSVSPLDSPFMGISSMPPSTVIGSGDLLNITQTAFDVWLTAFPELENVDINIGVGWADFMIAPNKIQTERTDPIPPTLSFDEASPDGILTDLAAFYVHADENFPDAKKSIPDSNLDGLILFNSQENLEVKKEIGSEPGRVLYYLDPDPLSSSIFGSVANENYIERQKNGINYGRSKFVTSEEDPFASLGANPNDLVIDVFSVALHELQHALGLTRVNPNAVDKLVPTESDNSNLAGNLDLKIDLPDFSGAIPTTYNANDPDLHLNDDLDLINETDFDFIPQSLDSRVSRIKNNQIPTPVSLEIVTDRERKCPSAADVLAIAEINGYTNYDTNPCLTLAKQRVPEPSTMFFLFGLGIYGSLQLRRNRLQ